jgi:hypothetical protein
MRLSHMGMSMSSEPKRQMEESLYRRLGARRCEFVRGVYWGNYLGPELRLRFDPTGELVKEFIVGVDPDFDPSEDETGVDYTHYAHETGDGGVFLALSESPTTWSDHYECFPERSVPDEFGVTDVDEAVKAICLSGDAVDQVAHQRTPGNARATISPKVQQDFNARWRLNVSVNVAGHGDEERTLRERILLGRSAA